MKRSKIIIIIEIITIFILLTGTVSADDEHTIQIADEHTIQIADNESIQYPLPLKLTHEKESFQDQPFVIFADNHFYVAYNSNKTGNYDIFIRKYDSNWNFIIEEQITTNQSNQYSPSIAFANKYLYIAYDSDEAGNSDVFVKIYDLDLNLRVEKKQITKDEFNQGFPSIAFANKYLYIAYGSNEKGSYDIFVEKYDQNLTSVGEGKKRITFEEYDQNDPSILFADGRFYIAYYTSENEMVWRLTWLAKYPRMICILRSRRAMRMEVTYLPLQGLWA